MSIIATACARADTAAKALTMAYLFADVPRGLQFMRLKIALKLHFKRLQYNRENYP